MTEEDEAHVRRLDIGLALLSVSFAAKTGLPTHFNRTRCLVYTTEQVVEMLSGARAA